MVTKKNKHKKEFDITADKAVAFLKKIFGEIIKRRVTVKDKKNKVIVRIPLIFIIILLLIPPISWVIVITFLILLIIGYKFTFEIK
jgi:hypothetical protein